MQAGTGREGGGPSSSGLFLLGATVGEGEAFYVKETNMPRLRVDIGIESDGSAGEVWVTYYQEDGRRVSSRSVHDQQAASRMLALVEALGFAHQLSLLEAAPFGNVSHASDLPLPDDPYAEIGDRA